MKAQLIAMLAVISLGAQAATISGTVNFEGKEKKPRPIKMNADPACQKATGGKTVLDDTTVINSGKVENVFVWLKSGVASGAGKKLTDKVILDQKDCMYSPKVSGVMVGQTLSIRNSDPFLHNVHSMSKKNKPNFNVGQATAGKVDDVTFKKPEVLVKVKCDVHGWMTTYIGVSPHSFFAVTDKNGKFTINDVPPGEYEIEAVHPKLKKRSEKVTVGAAGDVKAVDFSYGGAKKGKKSKKKS